MRDYLIFLGVFLAFIYCGFSTDKLNIRTKLMAQLNDGDDGFSSITSTAALQTWIDGKTTQNKPMIVYNYILCDFSYYTSLSVF
jgi:hypothetical protein